MTVMESLEQRPMIWFMFSKVGILGWNWPAYMGTVLIVSVESVLVQGGRSGWRETRFRIYFESKTKRICCKIGYGLGEEEKNHVWLRFLSWATEWIEFQFTDKGTLGKELFWRASRVQCGHVRLEMPASFPSGSAEWAIEYSDLDFRDKVRIRTRQLSAYKC